jgi:hypothetical protein
MQIVKALSGQGETVSRPKILVLASTWSGGWQLFNTLDHF